MLHATQAQRHFSSSRMQGTLANNEYGQPLLEEMIAANLPLQ